MDCFFFIYSYFIVHQHRSKNFRTCHLCTKQLDTFSDFCNFCPYVREYTKLSRIMKLGVDLVQGRILMVLWTPKIFLKNPGNCSYPKTSKENQT